MSADLYFNFRFEYDLSVRKIFFAILFLILFFFTTHSSFAAGEQTQPSPTPISQPVNSNGYAATVITPSGNIVETDPSVTVRFTVPQSEIDAHKKFFLCQDPSCDSTDDELGNTKNSDGSWVENSTPTTSTFDVTVCAEDEKLRTSDCETAVKDNPKYFFQGGNNYFLTLFGEDQSTKLIGVSFYMHRQFPDVNLTVDRDKGTTPKPGDRLTLTIKQNFLLGGGGDRNDYRVVITKDNDPGYEHGTCVTVDDAQKGATVPIPFDTDQNGLDAGSYTINVYEEYSERRYINAGCFGDFLFSTVHFTVDPKGGVINATINDPGKKDNSSNGINGAPSPTPPPPPCLEGWADENKTQPITILPGDSDQTVADKLSAIKICTKVATAFGPLEVDPTKLIGGLFIWLLGIAGIAAILIFLYSGYQLMTSGGNKEKVQGARDTITSAIVGLLFIIFSIAILEFIGIDILRLPGFIK